MGLIWETSLAIRAFDVDANNRLKVSTIFNYFQDAASNDAERLNFGYEDFVPLGLFWVLSWMKIECIEFPKFMDEVTIQTWPKKQYKLYSIRDYLMSNSKKELICKGTSAWLLLDVKTLRPKILTELYPKLKITDNKDALSDLPHKIVSSSQTEIVYKTHVRYSDIDLNQHANNAKYIELMLDCFSKEFHKENKIKSLVVSFNAESKYGAEIQLFKANERDNPLTHYIEAKNTTNSKIVFQSIIEWK